jgi:hypothetical protein
MKGDSVILPKLADLSKKESEPILKFDGVYLAFLNTFSLQVDKNITENKARKMLNSSINAEWEGRYSDHFKIAEDFILKELSQQRFHSKLDYFSIAYPRKYELDHFIISCPLTYKRGMRHPPISVEVFLAIYQKLNVGVLLFNLKLNNCTTDDLIFLEQCFSEDRFKLLSVTLPSFLQTQNVREQSIRDILDKYTEPILQAFGNNTANAVKEQRVVTTNLIEIRGMSDFDACSPDYLLKNFPKQIYGLLAKDEGWRFVPSEIASLRISKKWGTRDFISVIPFHNCVVFLNFAIGNRYDEYITSQQELRNAYGQKLEKYFTFNPEIAGLNHGPLLILENASVMRFLLNRILEPESIKHEKIKEFLKERDELNDTLKKLSSIAIREISDMDQTIKESMLIVEDIDEVKNKLKLVENTLIIEYNRKINHLVIFLSVVAVIVAIITVIVAIIDLLK